LNNTIDGSTDDPPPALNIPAHGVLRQRSDTAENSIDALSGGADFPVEEELLPEDVQPHRMPVLVAIGITVGWIFVCAALFKLWEDWSYSESCYFMFISLSTIGLGDLSVKRREWVHC
jgi:hypothetical protein